MVPEPWMCDYIPFGTETWDDLFQQQSLILRSVTAYESPQSLPTEKKSHFTTKGDRTSYS